MRSHTTPGLALFFILLLGSTDYAMVLEHLLAQFDGVVEERTEDVFYPIWTHNLVNRYVIRESDGRQDVYYADSSEGRRDGFAVGTRLAKQRWHMDYEENGQARNDFPFVIYGFGMMFNSALLVACVIIAIMIEVRDARARALKASVERARRDLGLDG
jgi:hypothetical protein